MGYQRGWQGIWNDLGRVNKGDRRPFHMWGRVWGLRSGAVLAILRKLQPGRTRTSGYRGRQETSNWQEQ